MTSARIAVVPPAVRTAGPQITRLAAVAGIQLDAAQRMIADATSGVRADGKWAAFENVIFAPRQNLKTEYAIARILAGLYVFREELVVFSAHQSRTTAKTFRRVKRAIEASPALGARITRVSNRLGAESIELDSGQMLECVARSTQTGRGFTGDCVLLDEAQDLDSEQLAAILPMLSTRPNPQVHYCLSQGNEQSTHLGALRARALARQDPHVCWIEWSMAEGDAITDREVWKRCNPAVEAGRITMDYLEREFLALGPEQFARERLGKSNWPQDSTGRFAVISRDAWRGCERPGASSEGGRVALGVAASRLGESAAVMACSQGADGLPVLELLSWRPSERGGWVTPYLAPLAGRHQVGALAWDDESPAREFGLTRIRAARTINPGPGDYPRACMSFLETVEQRGLAHLGQPELTAAVGAATARNTSRGWYFGADPYAAEVLAAAVWALHGYQGNRCPYDLIKSVA